MLPSKTIPEVKNRKCHALKPKTTKTTAAAPPRKKARITSGTEVEDSPHTRQSSGDAAVRSVTISPASSFQVSYPVPVKARNVSYIHSSVLTTTIECKELEEEPNLLILQNCCEWIRRNFGR
jgi:hypothetical protein